MPNLSTKPGQVPKDLDKCIKRGQTMPREELITRVLAVRNWPTWQRHSAKAQVLTWLNEGWLTHWATDVTRPQKDPKPRTAEQAKPKPGATLHTFGYDEVREEVDDEGYVTTRRRHIKGGEIPWPPRSDQPAEPAIPEDAVYWLFHGESHPVTASTLANRPSVGRGERLPITAAQAAQINTQTGVWKLARRLI